jgi:manganese/zinc/iron transport system permease protein
MVVLACVAGVISAVLGYALATVLDSSIAGSMATVSGLLFVLAALASPRHGVLPRWWRQRGIRIELAEKSTPS